MLEWLPESDYLETLVRELRKWRVEFSSGLTDREVNCIEERYGFRFPPDLRALLQYALPISHGFMNWRDASDAEIRKSLDWSTEGICFDIEHNNFWREDWGEHPDNFSDAFAIALQKVAEAPTLIPILGHRYLPAEPLEPGNPVFSVWQTDIIYYGYDLADYFSNEFNDDSEESPEHIFRPVWAAKSPRRIRFWSQFV